MWLTDASAAAPANRKSRFSTLPYVSVGARGLFRRTAIRPPRELDCAIARTGTGWRLRCTAERPERFMVSRRGQDQLMATGDIVLRSRTRGSTVDLALAGDLDMAGAFKVETQLDAIVGAPDVEAVAVDLREVAFIDSTGLGALLAARDRARQLGVDLTITSVSDPVRRVLAGTGLGDIADV